MACTVRGCSSRVSVFTKNNLKSNISFHRFPTDPELKQTWVKNVRKGDDWCPSQYTRICSLHFEDSCFREGYGRRTLHSIAVPTIFPNLPRSCQSKVPRKRKLIAKYGGSDASTSTAVENNERQVSGSVPKINHATQTDNHDTVIHNELLKKTKLLDKYKKLALRRGRKLKNEQRKCSRLSKKTADLEILVHALYDKMESEHVTILKNTLDTDDSDNRLNNNDDRLNTSIQEWPNEERLIFINDSLTEELVTDSDWKCSWSTGGKVFIRKEEGEPAVEIKSQVKRPYVK